MKNKIQIIITALVFFFLGIIVNGAISGVYSQAGSGTVVSTESGSMAISNSVGSGSYTNLENAYAANLYSSVVLSTMTPASHAIVQNTSTNWTLPFLFYYEQDPERYAPSFYDINSDGFIDVFIRESVGAWNSILYLNNGNGTWISNNQYDNCWESGTSGNEKRCFMSDINGDGLIDKIYFSDCINSCTGKIQVGVNSNTGKGMQIDEQWQIPSISKNYIKALNLFDINGDNLPDIVISHMNDDVYQNHYKKIIALNNGYGWDLVYEGN